MLKRYLAKGGKVLFMLDPPDKPESAATDPTSPRCSRSGASRSATTSSSTSAAWGSCSAPVPRCRSRRSTSRIRSRTASSCSPLTGSPGRWRRSTGGDERQVPAEPGRDQPEQLGRDRHQDAQHDSARSSARSTRETRPGPSRSPPPCRRRRRTPRHRPPAPSQRTPPSPRPAWWSSATPTSPPTAGWAFQGNRDLFLNTVNWLAQQENLISIRPRDPQDRRHHADGEPAEHRSGS